jgi:putative peptidoglycan lipid II flippase
MALIRSITTVGAYTLASRILGFVRDILVAAVLGAGPLADAFFVAFKLPNLFRRLFGEGAFNAAFVPLFGGLLEGAGGRAAAKAFAEQAFAVLLWALVALVALFEIAMPFAMYGFAPGFADDPAQFDLAVLLSRITFPYLLFISLVSLMAGVLNSLGRFAAAAATPILLNLCLIGAVLWLVNYTETPAHALAWGVAIAGMVQFIWLASALTRAHMPLRMRVPRLTPEVRTMLRRVVPGAIGAGVYQINLLVDMVIASLLPAGSISYLFFADRVNQLPLGVVGVAAGTALLPAVARQLAAGDETAAMHSQNRALEFSLFLTVPAAVALALIAAPIISVLFERGEFGPVETSRTAAALSAFALGLPAYVLVKALTPAFFARGDTATPVKAAAAAMAANLVLNLVLMGPLLHVGIALATALSAWLNVALLGAILFRRGLLVLDARLKSRLPRAALASAVMGAALYWGARLLDAPLAGDTAARVGALAALVAGGGVVFGLAALAARAVTGADLRDMLGRGSA